MRFYVKRLLFINENKFHYLCEDSITKKEYDIDMIKKQMILWRPYIIVSKKSLRVGATYSTNDLEEYYNEDSIDEIKSILTDKDLGDYIIFFEKTFTLDPEKCQQIFYSLSDFFQYSDFFETEYYEESFNRYSRQYNYELSSFSNITKIEIYNVGHGNVNAIYNDDDEILLFDFGTTRFNSLASTLKLQLNKVKYLIISHQHDDHYNLLNSLKLTSLKKAIIVNDFVKGTSLLRILFALGLRKVHIVPTARMSSLRMSTLSKRGKIELYSSKKSVTNPNLQCLQLAVIQDDLKYFFTGDASLSLVNDLHTRTQKNSKVSMVCPHHSGSLYTSDKRFLFEGKNVICSYLPGHGKYKTPKLKTLRILRETGFIIKHTSSVNFGDYIEL